MIRLPGGEDDDLLCGAKEIGAFIGKSEDQVKRLIKRRALPVFQLTANGRWHMRKSTWRRHVESLEERRCA